MLAAQRAARAQPLPAKKKTQGSARGSEERQTSASAVAPRGQKRLRDHDLEKVSCAPDVVVGLHLRVANGPSRRSTSRTSLLSEYICRTD